MGGARTHCAPFLPGFLSPGIVPQLKHFVSFEQPKITEVIGQREASGIVPRYRPRIDKCLEFPPCELCWVMVKEFLVRRQSSPDICRGGGVAFGDGHQLQTQPVSHVGIRLFLFYNSAEAEPTTEISERGMTRTSEVVL